MKSIKNQIIEQLSQRYMKDPQDANVEQLYNVVAAIMMQDVVPAWRTTRRSRNKKCAYISAEFLIGRLVYSNMLNLGLLEEFKEDFEKLGLDINMFEDIEDAALGNGGLGRLAACYLESAATKDINLDGFGIRYKYGLFKQKIVNGFQVEEADNWLRFGDPFSKKKEDEKVIVHFRDFDVYAVPYDMPVIGYESKTVNTLRLFEAHAINEFDFDAFNRMEGEQIALSNFRAEQISAVLYPNDNTHKGRILRLYQEYFMVSATMQSILNKFKRRHKSIFELPNDFCCQLNDTHPALAIPELIRLLELEGLDFNQSLDICRKMFNFTNHTILSEALEQWTIDSLNEHIPDLVPIIYRIQEACEKTLDRNRHTIIKDNRVNMAHLSIFAANKVNGVAKIHTDILTSTTFKDWYDVMPEKFLNVTNGITPRRWLVLNNEALTNEIKKRIGDDFITDLDQLMKMKKYADDETFLKDFKNARTVNKQKLVSFIEKHEGIKLDTKFMFDIQVKRLHEYKRQMLNALSILYIYFELKEGNLPNFKPTAFIFGAKAAPGYYIAKATIKFINSIANMVNNDPDMNDKMKVVFVSNYNVSYAEKLVCAADLSEQISLAGLEASGTSNMKFMLNGTPTLGTLDGANIEIAEKAGIENEYIFGMNVDEVSNLRNWYNPKGIYDENYKLRRCIDTLVDGTLSDDGSGMFRALFNNLLYDYNPDRFMVLADFDSYIATKLRANMEFDTKEYYQKCVINMATSSKFSSDRSVMEYDKNIWHLSGKGSN